MKYQTIFQLNKQTHAKKGLPPKTISDRIAF